MSYIDIEFVFIKNTNKIKSGSSNLKYRKQNATQYVKKNKSNEEYLNDKLESQIKDLYKNEVSLLKIIEYGDSLYSFYNIKGRKKNQNQEIIKVIERDKVNGDILVFKQNKKTYYFEKLNLDIFNHDLNDLLKTSGNNSNKYCRTLQH